MSRLVVRSASALLAVVVTASVLQGIVALANLRPVVAPSGSFAAAQVTTTAASASGGGAVHRAAR